LGNIKWLIQNGRKRVGWYGRQAWWRSGVLRKVNQHSIRSLVVHDDRLLLLVCGAVDFGESAVVGSFILELVIAVLLFLCFLMLETASR